MPETRQTVPTLVTYGESDTAHLPDLLHCELISTRSAEHEYRIHPHRHLGLSQVFVLHQGQGTASLDGKTVPVTAPLVLVIPEFCVHDFAWSDDVEGKVFSVATELVHQLEQGLGGLNAVFDRLQMLSVDADAEVFERVDELYQEYLSDPDSWRAGSLAAEVYRVGVTLARLVEAQTEAGEAEAEQSGRYVKRFQHLVNQHYTEHMSVEDYASQLGVTPQHLSSLCRQETGLSALGLIHQRVLLEARRCLRYTAMPVSRIAYQLGFQDPAYFTRFFKRHGGESPKEYRMNKSN